MDIKAVPPEITAQPPQGKLVQRSYHTPVGVVVDFGIQIGDTVYEPRASAVSPLGVSEAKKGWREVSEKDKENYRDWEKKPGAFGNRARKIADIEKRWNEIIAKGKTAQEHQVEQLASYESYMKRRAEAERQYSLKSSGLIVGMALEEIATGNRYVITEITDEGWVYARPEDEPTQSGGSIGKGEVKGYRLAVQKVLPTYETKAAPEVTKVMSVEEVSKLETRLPLKLLWKDEATYMDRLTTEIQEKGITEPVTIRVREDGSQIVWDGLHRLAVAQKLGIKDIPVQYIGEVGKLAIPKAGGNPGFTPEVTNVKKLIAERDSLEQFMREQRQKISDVEYRRLEKRLSEIDLTIARFGLPEVAIPKAVVTPVTPEVTKRPWQMTLEEFAYAEAKKYGHGKPRMEWIRAGYGTVLRSHKNAVELALSKSKPVPPEVLKDYPELAAKAVTSEVTIRAYRGVSQYPIYEGTPEVWSGFPVHPQRGVLHFTPDEAVASQYGKTRQVEITLKNPLYTEKWDLADGIQVKGKEELIKQGYDGIIYNNPADKLHPSQVIAFYENQIKAIPKAEAAVKGTKAPAEKGSLEQKANALLPMPPTDGPPLPRMFDLKWPWKK